MYEKLLASIHPGTEIKVTPESDAPIIPKATIYQGDCLFALKKASLLSFFPVKNEMIMSMLKYPTINKSMCNGCII